jgi:hypothetical protein
MGCKTPQVGCITPQVDGIGGQCIQRVTPQNTEISKFIKYSQIVGGCGSLDVTEAQKLVC